MWICAQILVVVHMLCRSVVTLTPSCGWMFWSTLCCPHKTLTLQIPTVDSGLFSPCAWLTLRLMGEHLLPISCLAGFLHCQCACFALSSDHHSPSATNAFLIDPWTIYPLPGLSLLSAVKGRGVNGLGGAGNPCLLSQPPLCSQNREFLNYSVTWTAVVRRVEGWHTKLIVGNITRKPI